MKRGSGGIRTLVLLLLSGAIIIHAAEPEYRIGEGEKIDTDFIKISTFMRTKGVSG